ncbi:hypothetical protein [Clostridium sp. BJN0001]|uniref:hypothetical protein n=1 Tax=Clostridium sp. BJN0001 TaxID=2930219 RepID=UPI001FD299BA|nr:hypothetical protein [Clostridium sp. BJN0001]
MANQICKDTGCCQANCSSPLYKDNSKPECCTVTPPVTCSSITNAVCTPILTEKIINCMTFQKTKTAFETSATFSIDTPPSVVYTVGDPICITKIGVSYNAIGLTVGVGDPTVHANGTPISLATSGPAFVCPTVPTSTSLYNEFTGTLSTDRCCYGDDDLTGVSYRFIQSEISFDICSLELLVKGKIGCNDFSASYFYPVLYHTSNLGISDFTFSGSLCLPRDKTLTIYDKFTPCLDIFSVTTNAVYAATNQFTASVELGLKVDKKMLFTDREELAVFVPQSSQLNCIQGTDNIPECPHNNCNI